MINGRSQVLIGLSAWTEHVCDIFQSLDIPSGLLTENVSESVAVYCRRFHPNGLRHEDLVLLIARALCSINERALAEQETEANQIDPLCSRLQSQASGLICSTTSWRRYSFRAALESSSPNLITSEGLEEA